VVFGSTNIGERSRILIKEWLHFVFISKNGADLVFCLVEIMWELLWRKPFSTVSKTHMLVTLQAGHGHEAAHGQGPGDAQAELHCTGEWRWCWDGAREDAVRKGATEGKHEPLGSTNFFGTGWFWIYIYGIFLFLGPLRSTRFQTNVLKAELSRSVPPYSWTKCHLRVPEYLKGINK
jgi:hypothetical protein